ncbi:MAG: FMN-binding protein [Oscillospiraceae bacterium]|nr:FMN-binding protein [Oscillospiraceae bacterium]
MKKDFIMPILVLSVICLIMSGALALTNHFTWPVVEEAAAERAEAARAEMIPEADGFILLETDGLPKTVTEVYNTANGTGVIFMVTATGGYGGEFSLIIGFGPDGTIIGSNVLADKETKGFGDRVFAAVNEAEAKGERFDGVAGATVTSKAYRRAIEDALEAYETVKGALS